MYYQTQRLGSHLSTDLTGDVIRTPPVPLSSTPSPPDSLEAIVRLVTRLEDQIEDLQAQLTRHPQPLIAAVAKELAKTRQTLARRDTELLEQYQLNHQLLGRFRELEREVKRGAAVVRQLAQLKLLFPVLADYALTCQF
jgi:exonuclease VII large subunit